MKIKSFIAADSSSVIAYLQNDSGKDVLQLVDAVQHDILFLPPIVVSEILSDPKLPTASHNKIIKMPQLPLTAGFWERAGINRALLLSKKFKARLADTLIAQSCIDNNVPLITRDVDFRHFAKHCGLKLA